jgi:phosphoglycerate kinase
MSNDLLIPPVPEGATRKRNVLDVLEALSGPSKILIRVDFNVPMDAATGMITDDSRIRGALPTIQAVLKAGHMPILCSHMGRPELVQKGAKDEATAQQRSELSLKPIGEYLSKLIDTPVLFADDCLHADNTIASLTPGHICLLENLRFYKAEEKNDPVFAATLAKYADAYINDAFGTCHRAHASTAGVPNIMENKRMIGIGALVASELAFLDFTNVSETDKISAIIGGSKVSTKLPVVCSIYFILMISDGDDVFLLLVWKRSTG